MTDVESGNLIGYAILKARYDRESKTFIDNYEQFLLSVVDHYENKPMPVKIAAEKMKKKFGIEIPSEVVKRIGRHVEKKGYLTRDYKGDFVSLTVEGENCLRDLEGEISDYRRAESVLEQKLRDCVRRISNNDEEMLAVNWKYELKKYIDSKSVDIIRKWRGDTAWDISDGDDLLLTRDERIHYIISKFVAESYLDASESFQSLVSLAQGAMLSTLLEGGSGEEVPKIDNLNIALDIKIVLDLLGLQGVEGNIAARDVLKMIHANGIQCFVFQKTLEEIDGILVYVEGVLRGKAIPRKLDGVIGYAFERSLQPSDLVIFRGSVEEKLNEMSVVVRDNPDYNYVYNLDEDKLRNSVRDYLEYENPRAFDRDILCLSAIHRMRKGRGGSEMEKSRYLFVTTNEKLVLGCSQFSKSEGYRYPLAVSFDYLAMRLWLRAPLASKDVPKDLLVAAAYAGLKPKPKIWDQILLNIDNAVVDGVIDENEARLLRLQTNTGSMYMDQLVASEKVDGNTFVSKAIEQVKNEIKEEMRVENRALSEKISKQEEDSARERAAMDQRYEELAGDRDQLSSRAKELRSHVADLEDKLSALRAGEEARKNWWMRFLTRVLQGIASFISFVAIGLLLRYVWPVFGDGRTFAWNAFGALGSFGISLFWPWRCKALFARISRSIVSRFGK